MEWTETGSGQQMCHVGDLTIYKFPDGHASCSEGGTWISALFISPEAALSWADDLDGAERRFKELNPPTGKGSNLVPARTTGQAP